MPRAAAPPARLDATERLAQADGLLRAGCFDCLTEGLRAYDAIRDLPGASQTTVDAATIGAIRAAVLLGLRERELGTVDDGYLSRARQAAETDGDPGLALLPLIDAAESMPTPIVRVNRLPDAGARRRALAFREGLPAFLSELRTKADDDPLSAYTWITVTCAFGDYADRSVDRLMAPFDQMRETSLVAYRVATCLGDTASLERLLDRQPRFVELQYWLGQRAVSARHLDEAEQRFTQAYAWRARWPAVTEALANLYFAFEEPARALGFYDQTLALVPDDPEAMLGRVKTLSVLGRHDDAFQAIALMVEGTVRILPGDAYYWRAWNDVQVGQLEDAWTDIEEANRLWMNSEVSKLAGIVAFRRRDLDTASQRFAVARRLNPTDCETTYYAGLVLAEQRAWPSSIDVFTTAAACFEGARQVLVAEIADIRHSQTTDERKMRQITQREQHMATSDRLQTTAFFNIAVACLNLSRFDEARVFANKVAQDEQFAARANELLKRLGPR